MDFARRQLLKYGWSDGKGLGKNENGISEAIKPKLKFDTNGIGHDAAEQFTYHWWENVYNQAAENINVKSDDGALTIESNSDKPVNISARKYLKKDAKALKYGTFLKKAKLTENGLVKVDNSESSDDETVSDNSCKINSGITTLTDEELFAACGGRTAHKGARHGLKLNGKLARIEEQELLLFKQLSNLKTTDKIKTKKKSKKEKKVKKKEKMNGANSDQLDIINSTSNEDKPVIDHNIRATEKFLSEAGISEHKIERRKIKKAKKQCKICSEKRCECSKSVFDISTAEVTLTLDTKRKKRAHESEDQLEQEETCSQSKKKRKHGVSDYNTVLLTDKQIKKKRKKEKKLKKRTEKRINKIADSFNNVSIINE